MAVVFSSPNMIIQIRFRSSQFQPLVDPLAISKGSFVSPINLKIASSIRHKPIYFAIKAYQDESKRPLNIVAEELQPKKSKAAPNKIPEADNFKEPEPERQILKFVEATQLGASSPKEKVAATQTSIDYQQVLKYPLVTEAAIQKIIKENTLSFMVDVRANKKDIRIAFENMLNMKTKRINTLINYDGTKKAYIQLSSDNQAATVAKKLKILA